MVFLIADIARFMYTDNFHFLRDFFSLDLIEISQRQFGFQTTPVVKENCLSVISQSSRIAVYGVFNSSHGVFTYTRAASRNFHVFREFLPVKLIGIFHGAFMG